MPKTPPNKIIEKVKIIGRCSKCKEIIVESKSMTEKEAKEKIKTAIRLAPINMPVCKRCGNLPPYRDVNHHYEINIEKVK